MKTTKDPHRQVITSELRTLERNRRQITRDLAAEVRKFDKARRALKTAKRNVAGALKRIDRRAQILNGRLAA